MMLVVMPWVRRSIEVALRCVLLRNLGDRSESGSIAHREVSQHLAIDLDIRGLQTLDEPGIWNAVHSGGGIDADDPESAEISLPSLAVTVGVRQSTHK